MILEFTLNKIARNKIVQNMWLLAGQLLLVQTLNCCVAWLEKWTIKNNTIVLNWCITTELIGECGNTAASTHLTPHKHEAPIDKCIFCHLNVDGPMVDMLHALGGGDGSADKDC